MPMIKARDTLDDEVDVEYQPTAYYKLLEEKAAGALNEEPDYAAR